MSSETSDLYDDIIETITLSTNRNISLRKIIQKSSNNKTIFIIHGSMGNKLQFNDLIDYILSKISINIIIYDVYGCGLSDKTHVHEAYSTNALLNDLIEIYSLFSTNYNILLSHSYGTCQATRLCKHLCTNQDTNISNKITGVILLGTTNYLPDKASGIFQLPVFILSWIQSYLSSEFNKIAFSSKTSESIKAQSYELSQKNDMFVVKSFYQQFEWCKNDDWIYLQHHPVLILQGKDDVLTTIDGANELVNIVKTVNNDSRISLEAIDDSGHQIMLEKHDIIGDHIVSFIQSL